MEVAISVDGVPIHLTAERWFHIVENHDDLAGYYDDVLATVEDPSWYPSYCVSSGASINSLPKLTFLGRLHAEADVLYINFERPQRATDTDDTKVADEGILLRCREDRLVGVTVLEASAR